MAKRIRTFKTALLAAALVVGGLCVLKAFCASSSGPMLQTRGQPYQTASGADMNGIATGFFGLCLVIAAAIIKFGPAKMTGRNGVTRDDVEHLHARISDRVTEATCQERRGTCTKVIDLRLEFIVKKLNAIAEEIKTLRCHDEGRG